MRLLLATLFLFLLYENTNGEFTIALLQDSESERQLSVPFEEAFKVINNKRLVTPWQQLKPEIRFANRDSFKISQAACKLLDQGVGAIFGPGSRISGAYVQSVCDAKQVPRISVNPLSELDESDFSVGFYPHRETLSKATVEILRGLNWKKFTILYDDNDALARIQTVLQHEEFQVTLKQLHGGSDYRSIFKELNRVGCTHILFDAKPTIISDALRSAMRVGMVNSYHDYFINSLDFHTLDLEEVQHAGSNITSIRLLKEDQHEDVIRTLQRGIRESNGVRNLKPLRTEDALIYDGVMHLAKALDELSNSMLIKTMSLPCNGDQIWDHGAALHNFMRMIQTEGLTGIVKFDAHGHRKDISLDIVSLSDNGLQTVGQWTSTHGVNYTKTFSQIQEEIVERMKNRTLIVTTIQTTPYVMRKESKQPLIGNDRFEGFAIDLLKEVANLIGFNYTIRPVKDTRYGNLDSSGNWNGMIGELLNQESDIAVADLTITYEREKVVDFTMPFMNLGIGVLYRKPTSKAPSLFSFLSPFSLEIWICIASAYLGISLLLFLLSRYSPYEFSANSSSSMTTRVRTDFGVHNSLWFMICTLMQQGSDIFPKAPSTRIVASIWWFFTLIMVSSYTANLAAFLTVERMDSPIESVEDLASQTRIKYGCVHGGSTAAFFKNSNIPTYQRMWSAMSSNRPTSFVSSNSEGMERVIRSEGRYALLMESTSIDYVVQRHCGLTQIGGLLDSKGYGIALPLGSPYTNAISAAILNLQESGRIQLLWQKWWMHKKGGGVCTVDSTVKIPAKTASLSLSNVGGVFVVLLMGMAAGIVVALGEFIWKSGRNASQKKGRSADQQGDEMNTNQPLYPQKF